MKYKIVEKIQEDHYISRHLHSVFFEYFGNVIYDGIWVGRDSKIPNIDGIRLDVIEGCKDIGVGAMRWPGGCCADHYHWKNGIGPVRYSRMHPIADPANPVWRNDFGTDEFLRFCELVGADPILTVNTATGTPEEFLDWFEYVNGSTATKYGAMRAQNGHAVPWGVKYWGIGNTDENVWHIDFNNPVAYAQTYLKYQTVLREDRRDLYFIGLGLSTRHALPGWTGKALDHITRNGRDKAPDALSVHHYLGGAKGGENKLCGDAVEYSDAEYYKLLELLRLYQYDIDLHRITSREHTDGASKICFDEWGAWHPEATMENNQNQRQTVRDAIFAALSLHIFYRNSDVVDFAMETQLCNLLQSVFETNGEKLFKTPTYYVMKLLKEHTDQYLVHSLADDIDERLHVLASVSKDGQKLTISIVNTDLYEEKCIGLSVGKRSVERADIVTSRNVRDFNTFDEPELIRDVPFTFDTLDSVKIPAHSIVRICFKK